MKELIEHEKLEIEVLELLKNNRFLNHLVFVGGTMLRLCHELSRYSVDLDFRFAIKADYDDYFKKLDKFLGDNYQITDSKNKSSTLLLELKSPISKRRLKIEVRKFEKKYRSERKIAFSPHSNKQVLLNGLTLEESLQDKIKSAVSRQEIRDFFDIEFLLRRGVALLAPKEELNKLLTISGKFKELDFKVKLGSIISKELRSYYIQNRFKFLEQKINSLIIA